MAAVVAEQVHGHLREYARLIDEELVRLLDAEVDDPWMHGAIAYHLGWADADFTLQPGPGRSSAGKRLRPALSLLCFEAARHSTGAISPVRRNSALDFAVAVELVHNYSLIHDDIQDRGRLRRGRPALWTLCGDAQAINVGDCLHDLAYRCLTRRTDESCAPTAVELVGVLADAAVDMTVGQSRDLILEDETRVDVEDYLHMIAGKTGALMQCATYGGARLAVTDASQATLAAYRKFGGQFGLGFQIRDDILGIWGDRSRTGKSATNDIRQRKKSLPVVLALREADAEARRTLASLYADDSQLTDNEEYRIRRILDRCGAAKLAQRHAERHCRRALAALVEAGGGPEALRTNAPLGRLQQLTEFITHRRH